MDDEFAELLLTKFSDDFDAVPPVEVSLLLRLQHVLTVNSALKALCVSAASRGCEAGISDPQRCSSSLRELFEKQRRSASSGCHHCIPACS